MSDGSALFLEDKIDRASASKNVVYICAVATVFFRGFHCDERREDSGCQVQTLCVHGSLRPKLTQTDLCKSLTAKINRS